MPNLIIYALCKPRLSDNCCWQYSSLPRTIFFFFLILGLGRMNNVPVTFSQLCCHLKRICTTVLHASSTQVESWLYVVGELITHSPITATASLVLWPCRLVYSWKEIKNFAISMLLLYDWVFFFFKHLSLDPREESAYLNIQKICLRLLMSQWFVVLL